MKYQGRYYQAKYPKKLAYGKESESIRCGKSSDRQIAFGCQRHYPMANYCLPSRLRKHPRQPNLKTASSNSSYPAKFATKQNMIAT